MRCAFEPNMSLITKLVLELQAENINPLPNMPILGSSISKANEDMMSKTWTNRYTVI